MPVILTSVIASSLPFSSPSLIIYLVLLTKSNAMSKPLAAKDDARATHEIAERLHSGALRLLRRLRKFDSETQVSAPKLSALSVLVFGGPQSLSDLANAEQVRAPTMSRLVAELEADGL